MVINYEGKEYVLVFDTSHISLLGLEVTYSSSLATENHTRWVKVQNEKHLSLLRIQYPNLTIHTHAQNLIEQLNN